MRSGRATVALCLAFALASSTPSVVDAQPSVKARIESDRLFREGKRLYDAGDYKAACEAFASSDELDPAIGTLGLLAACHEKLGDLLLAWKEYRETARRAVEKKDSRAEFATQQAEALKARLGRIEIRKAIREPGLDIKRDGESLLESELGAPIRVNPGEHKIVARSTDYPAWKTTITVKEGETRVVDIPALDVSQREGGRWVPPWWLIGTAGGVGVAGVVAGSVAGSIAISKNTDSLSKVICEPTSRVCPTRDEALSAATASTIAFTIGGAGLAAGTALFIVRRSRSSGDPPASSPVASALRGPLGVEVVGVAPVIDSSSAGAVVIGVF